MVPHKLQAFLGANDKERAGLMEDMQPGVIEITAIHDVKSSRLDQEQIQSVDVVTAPVGRISIKEANPQARDQIEQRCAV